MTNVHCCNLQQRWYILVQLHSQTQDKHDQCTLLWPTATMKHPCTTAQSDTRQAWPMYTAVTYSNDETSLYNCTVWYKPQICIRLLVTKIKSTNCSLHYICKRNFKKCNIPVSIWRDEVKAAVNTGVGNDATVDTCLGIHVLFISQVNVVHKWLPATTKSPHTHQAVTKLQLVPVSVQMLSQQRNHSSPDAKRHLPCSRRMTKNNAAAAAHLIVRDWAYHHWSVTSPATKTASCSCDSAKCGINRIIIIILILIIITIHCSVNRNQLLDKEDRSYVIS